jgi:hypothetical protein
MVRDSGPTVTRHAGCTDGASRRLAKGAILLESIVMGKRLATKLSTPATEFDLPRSEESVILTEDPKFPQ